MSLVIVEGLKGIGSSLPLGGGGMGGPGGPGGYMGMGGGSGMGSKYFCFIQMFWFSYFSVISILGSHFCKYDSVYWVTVV